MGSDLPTWNPGLARALGLSLLLAAVQTAGVLCLTPWGPTPGDTYLGLGAWDSIHYLGIAEHGYRHDPARAKADPAENNVGFFPGYPLAGRALATLLHLPPTTALLLTAQLACAGFWAYVLCFLRRGGASGRLAAGTVLAVAAHPAAFYLVVGYSESLFLAALLGYLFWWSAGGRLAALLAAAHGFVLTATRIIGLPLAFVPAAASLRGRRTEAVRGLLVAGVAALGGMLFLAYCHRHFGRWDVYMQLQQSGWGVVPDYLAPLRPGTYVGFLADLGRRPLEINDLSRLSVSVTLLTFVLVALVEHRTRAGGQDAARLRLRLVLYGCAAAAFYVSAAGLASIGLASMVRYTFVSHVLLLLALALRLAEVRSPLAWTRGRPGFYLASLALLGLALQGCLAYRFLRGLWVA